MKIDKYPPISDDLIEALEDHFPEPRIGPDWDHAKVQFMAGQRAAVRHLKVVQKRQQKKNSDHVRVR